MNHNFKDITGERFGSLTVIEYAYTTGKAYWSCKCDCGNTVIVAGDKLRRGHTKSCGCLQEKIRKAGIHKTHGETRTRLYSIWSNMRARCKNPKCTTYKSYGARGISVCESWEKYDNFAKWAKENGYEPNLSLERIDVNGNYEPQNCTWIKSEMQGLNKRTNHRVSAFGKTMTIKEWADETGIKYDTIERRLNQYGWSAERALTELPHKGR